MSNNSDIDINQEDTRKGKNIAGRPRAAIWNFFVEGEETDAGHHLATCFACNTHWERGKPSTIECHILIDCKKINPEIKATIQHMVEI